MLGDNDTVIRFYEKCQPHEATYVNAGIYILNQEVLDPVSHGKPCSIEHEVFPALARRGLCAFRQHGPLIEIGTPDSFTRAQKLLPELLGHLPGGGARTPPKNLS